MPIITVFEPRLKWVDRISRLFLLNGQGAPYRANNVKQIVEKFLDVADLMPLNPHVEVIDVGEWHEGATDQPLRLKGVSPKGDSIVLFCFCSAQSRRGATVKVKFPVNTFPHDYAMIRDAMQEFNDDNTVVSGSGGSRRQKPKYINGGQFKGTHASP